MRNTPKDKLFYACISVLLATCLTMVLVALGMVLLIALIRTQAMLGTPFTIGLGLIVVVVIPLLSRKIYSVSLKDW